MMQTCRQEKQQNAEPRRQMDMAANPQRQKKNQSRKRDKWKLLGNVRIT